jgi:hypothetical protein
MDKSIPPSYKAPDPVKVRFGKRLRELRTSKGSVQPQLAMQASSNPY